MGHTSAPPRRDLFEIEQETRTADTESAETTE